MIYSYCGPRRKPDPPFLKPKSKTKVCLAAASGVCAPPHLPDPGEVPGDRLPVQQPPALQTTDCGKRHGYHQPISRRSRTDRTQPIRAALAVDE